MNPTSSTETTNNAAAVRHEDLVAAIDARLAAVDQQLAAFDVLRQERDRLFRARRALVGGDPGGGEARLSATTVLAMLAGYPGSTTGELAALLGSGDSAVCAHLRRARLAAFSALARVGAPLASAAGMSPSERQGTATTTDRSPRPTSSARRRGVARRCLLSSETQSRGRRDEGSKPLHDGRGNRDPRDPRRGAPGRPR